MMQNEDTDPWIPRKQWPWWLTIPYALMGSALLVVLAAWRMSLGPRSIPEWLAMMWWLVIAAGLLIAMGIDKRVPDRLQARLARLVALPVILIGIFGFVASFYLTS